MAHTSASDREIERYACYLLAMKQRKRVPKGRKCGVKGCLINPSFGFFVPTHCSKHKQEGMRRMIGDKCIIPKCNKSAVYGLVGGRRERCVIHKEMEMVVIPRQKL